ncbi:MAG: hypothetical protein HYR88_01110 [Verrucomicrobia bacterium]|nr:hypothetical protein [Verrucomicrobiota bacterium]MBI3868834.1 hypothetical protein [Verrucomicrobiota bacterium]
MRAGAASLRALCLAVLLPLNPARSAAAAAADRAGPEVAFKVITVYERATGSNRFDLFVPSTRDEASPQLATTRPVCRALLTSDWPAGPVPLFWVELARGFELRRRPLKGQENFTAPLFHAIAPANDLLAPQIAGLWSVTATNAQRVRHMPPMELGWDGERIFGRFDQNTDYRFAYLTGGALRSNVVQISVEYINDKYWLEGTWRPGRMDGRFSRLDGDDAGVWNATRRPRDSAPHVAGRLRPLFVWTRASDGAQRYALEGFQEPGWTRAVAPLCQAWEVEPQRTQRTRRGTGQEEPAWIKPSQ